MALREITVRSLTSHDRLNRDCLVTEFMRQAGMMTKVARRCTYRIVSRVTVPSLQDSIAWAKDLDPLPDRQVYVHKDVDPHSGDERVTYKVLGYLYVVVDREVLCVSFRHVLSMSVESADASCE
ncbi:MAG: hypothetical protein A3I71_01020 [Omnitrophica WOR_2 bacterium RIFCSPLOWO2_02_FULL_63_16]|nr:MAG: hypothetical protein A2Z92_06530 [Omnitrophica WOR_2 bacterium GWA2_63_20]OGX16239.1 MAG: hypothetical protein A2105_01805 [Omnitrophica WOR_2 bacterium GWF2_63_9]OGX31193.1 MAG: hypothetical protein A3E56_03960 [Omnitrophica WOR_2 bacterium RIFCSPHIGHO2_12_FULL_64_13]OGX35914.1 MAG: hypothetical protein A3B73_05660 [Omnitrophica WOR_2 bacterium RIFCSPHIGHO2_02_FULL_63_39]OGX45359.1 MAG: hypothetical protein A3I71_01020 [Omnitrophica WOR_2 bacterium RIFCSPLOWO2_02_FULL_63_16]OGX49142.1